MERYRDQDLMNFPQKAVVVRAIKEVADLHLAHLFQLDEKTISNVLTALAHYCEEKGAEAAPEIYKHSLLKMVQFQGIDGQGQGFGVGGFRG